MLFADLMQNMLLFVLNFPLNKKLLHQEEIYREMQNLLIQPSKATYELLLLEISQSISALECLF